MLYILAEPRSHLALEDSDISLVRLFNALSKEQRSYKIIATPEQLRRHGFYLSTAISEPQSSSPSKII